jgi:type II secretory pathway component HofQ
MKFLAIFVLAACILSARFANAADLITVDARDTLIADVIRLIGAESNQNIVPDATVRDQRITFRLKAVTVEAALGTLAAAYNLQFHRAGNIILIGDAAAMNRRNANLSARPCEAGRRSGDARRGAAGGYGRGSRQANGDRYRDDDDRRSATCCSTR